MTGVSVVPEALHVSVWEAESGQIVDERVDPDVDDLRRIAGEGNAHPADRAASRDMEISESPRAMKFNTFPLACLRNDAHSARSDQVVQLVLICTQTEEPVVLRNLDQADMVSGHRPSTTSVSR